MDVINQILSELSQIRRDVVVISNMITYSTLESAEYLGCSVGTIRNMVNDGTLHPVSARGDWRFRKNELDGNEIQGRVAKAKSISDALARKRRRTA